MNPTETLRNYLISHSPLAIALSGGVDSSTLTFFCRENGIEFSAYTFFGPHLTSYEAERVRKWVGHNSVPHTFIHCNPLEDCSVSSNPLNRCYYCKYILYSRLKDLVNPDTSIIDGTNGSDLLKYRPGHTAINELGIKTPFASLGFHRSMVEKLAKDMHMDIPRFSRSCLFTRFEYGYHLDSDLVQRLGEAEDYLLKAGINGFRIRIYKNGLILLHVDPTEKNSFFGVKPVFDSLMQNLDFYPYQLQFMEFSSISGYFDRN